MKIRIGFVSNSSSDSYLIATIVKKEAFEKWIKAIFAAYITPLEQDDSESVSEVAFEDAFERAMVVRDNAEPQSFKNEVAEFYGEDLYDHVKEHLSAIDQMVHWSKEMPNRGFLRVDSISDNSIPYGVQKTIEARFPYNVRIHWG